MKKQKETTREWWYRVSNDPSLLVDWLKKQYHGELGAVDRIKRFADNYAPSTPHKETLYALAEQEEQHAQWVGELLMARGYTPEVLKRKERYWDETLPQIESWETGCAVAAHAETMRLERIMVIACDTWTHPDISEVFARILPDELGHVRTFKNYVKLSDFRQVVPGHVKGLEALGLVI